ncbi:MAG: ATP-dependent DNA ligase [Nocardioidaceae bacterium]|nr:ATP-dependent DNA ligase [Nocardioidaceae bacterium]
MLFTELAQTSRAVSGTRARATKRALLAALLAQAAPDEIEVAVSYLSGQVRQRRTGIGWRSLADPPPPADTATLTLLEVDAAFAAVAAVGGSGSQQARREALVRLLGRATAEEQDLLRRLLLGEVRQGALDALVLESLAAALGIPASLLRRAAMLLGSTPAAARVAVNAGSNGLRAATLQVGRPVLPMLAASAADVDAGLDQLAPYGGWVVADVKLDGIRIQAHKDGADVLVVTRTLDDITDRLPEVVEQVRGLRAERLVVDGEVVALRPDDRPHPFQVTAARTASRGDAAALRATTPLSTYLFDLLHLDGRDLLPEPLTTRSGLLGAAAPADLLVPRLHTDDRDAVARFFTRAVQQGHEGIVLKAPDAPYEAGRRGSAWVKVKPRHTLDLVVLAAEWGHGRRAGWLSNLQLGARRDDVPDPTGAADFVMLGKTFKGLTDQVLAWQTEQLLGRETGREGHVVRVRPELVVEIAADGAQRSSRYPGGVTLRFARVLGYRDDLRLDEVDPLATVRALLGS